MTTQDLIFSEKFFHFLITEETGGTMQLIILGGGLITSGSPGRWISIDT